MFEEEITEKDVELLNEIMDHNYTIRILYKNLMYMEITNNKDTDNYRKCLTDLKGAIDVEKELYSKLQLTPIKSRSIIRSLVLTSDGYSVEENNVLEVIANSNLSNLEFCRLLIRLEDYAIKHDDIYEQFLKGDPLVINHKDLMNFIVTSRLIKADNNDLERAFIYFNQKEIEKCEDGDVRDQLIMIKYALSFISGNVEEVLLDNNFEVSDDLYFSSGFHADLMKIPKEKLDKMQISFGYNGCRKAINEMMYYDDTETDFPAIELEQSIWSSYLKSSVSFFFNTSQGEKEIDEVKRQVFDFNDQICNQASQSTDFIFECLDEAKTEKTKFKYLSLFRK